MADTGITKKIKRLKSFQKNVINISLDEVMKRENFIVKSNVDQIYNKGLNADNKKITNSGKGYPVYSRQYEQTKRRAGIYQGHVDLSFGGGYLASYKVEVKKDQFEIRGHADVGGFDLAAFLRKIYKNVEGLTDKDLNKLIWDYVYKRLLIELKKV